MGRVRETASLVVLLVTVVLPAYATATTVEVQGQLSDAVFERYFYSSHEVVTSGAALTVSVSSELDTYLHLTREGGGAILSDDDGAGGGNARITVPEGAAGRWLAIVTTYRPDVTGEYTLVVDSSDSVPLVEPKELSGAIITAAFAGREIVNREAERTAQRELLRDQLLLDSFRSRLIEILAANASGDPIEQSLLRSLEVRERALVDALAEAERTLSVGGKEVIAEVLGEELERTRRELAAEEGSVERQAIHRAAYSVALDELRALDERADALRGLEELLLSAAAEISLADLRRRVTDLRAAILTGADELAGRFLDTAFVRQLSFSAMLSSPESVLQAIGGRSPASDGIMVFGGGAVSPAESAVAPLRTGPAPNYSGWLTPLFPWPPPEASSRVVLGEELIPDWPKDFATLGEVGDVLGQALTAADYPYFSYWGVAGGFAVVSQLEQTTSDGDPVPGPDRWAAAIVEMKDFTLSGYLRALFTAPIGYYRILAFIVTPEPFATTRSRDRFETIQRWARAGHDRLPRQIRELAYTPDHEVTVLVYEFHRSGNSEDPLASIPGRVSAAQHLRRSAILAGLL